MDVIGIYFAMRIEQLFKLPGEEESTAIEVYRHLFWESAMKSYNFLKMTQDKEKS